MVLSRMKNNSNYIQEMLTFVSKSKSSLETKQTSIYLPKITKCASENCIAEKVSAFLLLLSSKFTKN